MNQIPISKQNLQKSSAQINEPNSIINNIFNSQILTKQYSSIPICNPVFVEENFSFHGQVNTKFGVVKIIKSQGMTLPRGWRRLSWQEGQQIQSQLFSIL